MRFPSGVVDQYLYFVAVNATDLKTRETGLSSFTVYRSRNGAAAAAMTTPTINETDTTNMPGVYELLLDEDMTIASGNDSEEMVFHITATGMAPVTRTIELYRPKITAGNTLDVTATGAAGIDWGNIENPTTTVDLSGTDIQLCDTVTTLTGHTAQTGDSFARIGANGASLSAIPWNASWDAEVQSECTDALNAYDPPTRAELTSDINGLNDLTAAQVNAEVDTALSDIHLDHLLAVDYDPASKPGTATALLNELVESDSGVSRFTVNALENGPSGSGASAAAIADAVWDEAQADHVSAGSFGETATEIASILADTNELQTDDVPGLIATAQTDLDTLTGSDGVTLATSQPNYAPATATALATVDTVVDGIQTDLSNGTDGLGALKTAIDAIFTTQMTESYASDGTAPTPAQALFLIQQALTEFAIASTTKTVKRIDGSTPAATFTLDDATSPTSLTRAT